MSPSVIPFTSLNTTTNPVSWPACVGTGCQVIRGLPAPDGSMTAAEIITGSVQNPSVLVENVNTSAAGMAVGDWLIYGGWCMPGQNNALSCGNASSSPAISAATNPADVGFDYGGVGAPRPQLFYSGYYGDWWIPIVAASKVTTGASGARAIQLKLLGPQINGSGTRFWQPFIMYIPVSAIPSWIAGSITAGTFTAGETVTQAVSGATAKMLGAFVNSMTVNTITGTPDTTDIWTGGTSAATFTPTAAPLASMTQTQWDREIARWRQQLLHAWVPANAVAGTAYSNSAMPVNTGPLTAASANVAAVRKGTFVCTAGGTITISNANYVATSDVTITMKTAAGTITTPPAMKTVTPGTGFTVLCGATDTSTYNYSVLN